MRIDAWGQRRHRNQRSSRRSFRPRLEGLEERQTPAGDVTASFSTVTGALTIIGVDDASKTGVLDGLNDQRLTINGGLPGNLTVFGDGGTKINGLAAASFTGVKSIRFDMRLGNDAVTINKLFLDGSLTFNGGAGSNTLTIGGVAGNQGFGSVTVRGGDDNDVLFVGNGSVAIAGALTFNGGAGGSKVTLGAAGDEVSIGRVSVTNGEGTDFFIAGGAKFDVAAGVTINNGVSASTITSLIAADTTLGGNLALTNLAGADVNVFGAAGGTFEAKGISINSGDGRATITFAADNHDLGSIAITNGVGFDTVKLGAMTVAGNLSINNRSGGSIVLFTGATIATQRNLTVLAGKGDDVVSADGANLTVHGALSLSTGSGLSLVTLAPTSKLTVDGATTITGGGDEDNVTVGTTLTSSQFQNLTINVGSGDSNTKLLGPVAVNGNLAVTGRDGTDAFSSGGVLTVDGNAALNLGNGPGVFAFLGMGTSIGGALTATGLDGTHVFNTGGVGFTVDGAASIRTGDGDLVLDLAALTNTFNGPLSITTLTGDNKLNFTGKLKGESIAINSRGSTNVTFTSDVTAMGNLSVTTAAANDTVFLGALPLYVGGSLTLNTGGGNDLVDWAPTGATVLGGATIRTGDGADAVRLNSMTFGGAVSIDLGSLDDNLGIDDCHFFGAVSVNCGAGGDLVRIEQQVTPSFSEFKGAVTVRLGGGDDDLVIGLDGDLVNRGEFSVGVTIDGGAGLDIAELLPTTDGGTRHNSFTVFPTFPGVEAVT